MKTKLIQSIPAVLAILAISFRYFSTWCVNSVSSCYGSWIHQIYQYFTYPLFSFSIFVLPIAIILIFVRRDTFKTWLKFALWAIPLAIIFVAMIPVNSIAYMDFFPFYRNDAARLAGEVFSVISLILIVCRALRSAPAK